MTTMKIAIANTLDASVVAPVGDLDLASAARIQEAIESIGGGDVVIDLRRVAFMDSMGLLALLRAVEAVRGRGQAAHVITGPPCVDRLFDLTETRSHFEFADPSLVGVDAPTAEIWLG
jgi:anti-anti-sigma factor